MFWAQGFWAPGFWAPGFWDESVDPNAPVLIDTAEVEISHSTVTLTVSEAVPVGANVFVDFTTSPNPLTVDITDDRGNTYAAQVDEGTAHLYRGFVGTTLQPGDEITITYGAALDQTAANAYYVPGLANAGPSDFAHVNDQGSVGPVDVPEGGIALAAAYIRSSVAEAEYTQDPNFTDIASARTEVAGTVRRVDSSYRLQSGSYSYDPTTGVSQFRLTLAAYLAGAAAAIIVLDLAGPQVARNVAGPQVARTTGGPGVTGEIAGPAVSRDLGGPQV